MDDLPKSVRIPMTACNPSDVGLLSRRQMLKAGVSMVAYMSLAKLLQAKKAFAAPSFPLQRKLVWGEYEWWLGFTRSY